MAEYIQGDDLLFFIDVEGEFVPAACLTNNSLSETTEAMETTVRGNNGWRSYAPTIQDYTVSLDGVVDSTEGVFSYVSLQGLKRAKVVFNWRMATSLGGIYDEGAAFISSLVLNGPAGDLVSFSATLTPSAGGITDVLVWSQDGTNVVTQDGINLIAI